ncbi:pilus (MSHA type) biogenesis protein MshL [Hydrogenimonas cancrithermarum]|uniref:Pilus (MSHA type) biogenesis protein MshL n=1 Tax=Hydrogenimonas cancrithermarum TaxID=2993563 RepID=A0ABM8FI72_9BACT|nr:pilus (MSHA type) biogenesis protein MshL [Hydrogenimonas cancrithermarum]BDY11990.1 pilus (MSHA type) biogenesis protein MshL [Hydrogenimonas cancrithermarum]
MKCMKKIKLSLLAAVVTASFGLTSSLQAACEDNLFNIKANQGTRISELIDQLAEQCDLTLIVKDKEAAKRLRTRLNRFSLKDVTLPEVLQVALNEHNLNYSLDGNILKISYLLTKTYHVDYISTDRESSSKTRVMLASGVANQQQTTTSGSGTVSTSNMSSGESESGIDVTSNDKFVFWAKLQEQIRDILNRPEDEYKAGDPVIDKESGLVTITGTKKQLDRVEGYLDNLIERLHKQVLIDVKMYAVVLSKGKETGIDWRQLYNLQNFTISGERLQANENVGEITFPGAGDTPYISKFVPGKIATFTDIVMNAQIGTIIKFLQSQGDVHSVSNPKVLTLNNQAAMITVGKQYFYKIKNSTTTSNTGGSTVAQNEIIDSVFAGILLDITPEIAADGTITLKINPSVSDTINPVTNENENRTMPPDLERRQMASVVTVKDGSHVILGGLITDRVNNSTHKVPLLGDIPILGYAFKYDELTDEKIELVIIVTPHLVKAKNSMTLKDLGYDRLSDSNMTRMR